MHIVQINKKTFKVPSGWDEINHRQLLKIAPLILGREADMSLRSLIILFELVPGIKRYWLRHRYVGWIVHHFPGFQPFYPILSDAQKWDILQLIMWVVKDLSGKSIISDFWHQNVHYFLPRDNLVMESIIAFAFADDYFTKFVESGDVKNVDLLISCLAREERSGYNYKLNPQWDGDCREPFQTEKCKVRADAFAELPFRLKNAILIYFLGSKQYLHKQYAVLFKEEDSEKPEGDAFAKRRQGFGVKKVPRPSFGWLGVIYELAEIGVFGPFNSAKHMFLHTCCYYLAKKTYDYEEHKP